MAVYREVDTRPAPVAEEEVPVSPRAEHRMNVAARVIYLIGTIVIALLAIRFLLALLGANPANGFANFIYSVTHPLASPFFSLFSYDQTLGRSKFELGTLVAILIYGLVVAVLARLVTIGSRNPA